MTSRRLPTLASLDALIAAVRCQSFSEGADRLALSVPAFSRRIRQLEAAVGVRLFDRMPSGIALTAEGERYLAEIEPALQQIRHATAALCSRNTDRPLRLAASQSFASQWLGPRLAAASAATGTRIDLERTRDPQRLRDGWIDLAVWGGEIDADLPSEKLFDAEAVAVVAASHESRTLVLDEVASIQDHRVLNVETPGNLWERWFDALGCQPSTLRATHFDTLHHVYDAASAGLGVALAIPLVYEPYLANERMRACLAERAPLGMGYRLYYSDGDTATSGPIARFREWLHREVRHSCDVFDRWWIGQRNALLSGH